MGSIIEDVQSTVAWYTDPIDDAIHIFIGRLSYAQIPHLLLTRQALPARHIPFWLHTVFKATSNKPVQHLT